MWVWMLLYTLFCLVAAAHQTIYWIRQKKQGEARLAALWMFFAWGLGMLFIGGMPFPMPKRPLFPQW